MAVNSTLFKVAGLAAGAEALERLSFPLLPRCPCLLLEAYLYGLYAYYYSQWATYLPVRSSIIAPNRLPQLINT